MDFVTRPAPSPGPTPTSLMHLPGQGTIGTLSPERVERLRRLYEEELSRRISLEERESARLWGGADDLPDPNASAVATTSSSSSSSTSSISSVNAAKKGIKWKDFRRFLWDQEEQLWDIFCDLDRDGDGRLDHKELKGALSRSGQSQSPSDVHLMFPANT
jgi:solute carrier family 25 phosphate transporter 23/24/25/41